MLAALLLAAPCALATTFEELDEETLARQAEEATATPDPDARRCRRSRCTRSRM